MSLYKNLGSITFHSESTTAQIFTTPNHWLIQPKSPTPSCPNNPQNPTTQLSQLCQKYNRHFCKPILQTYSEANKLPCLLMDRNIITKLDVSCDRSIQFMCRVCGILVESWEIVWGMGDVGEIGGSGASGSGTGNIGRIEEEMFFGVGGESWGFYLWMGVMGRSSRSACDSIVSFLQSRISSNQVSNRLLLTKLKKSKTLKQLKEQLDYFQKVYEIGSQKPQLPQKPPKNAPTPTISQNFDQFKQSQPSPQSKKLSHRRYRKRSEEVHQQGNNSKHYSISLQKRFSSSERRDEGEGLRNWKSVHGKEKDRGRERDRDREKQNTKITLFSNRNKLSKGLHMNSTSPGRFQVMGSFALSKDTNKSLFFKSKLSNPKPPKSKKLPTHSITTFQFTKTSQSGFNPSLSLSNPSFPIPKNLSTKTPHKNQKQQKIISRHYDELLLAQSQVGQGPKDDRAFKQVIANSLKNYRDRRGKGDVGEHKQRTQNSESSKSLRRIIRNSKESARFVEEGWIQQLIEKQDENQPIMKKPTKTQQQPRNQPQQQTFQNQQTIRSKNPIDQPLLNPPKMPIPKSQPQPQPQPQHSQPSHLTTPTPQISQIKNSPDKQKQIQKTTRRKNAHVVDIVEGNFLRKVREEIQRVNYVGECVTAMPAYIADLVESQGDKYLWQLPAFILYKEFYIRRLEIQQKLKQQLHNHPHSPSKPELTTLLHQLQSQNALTKQSLSKLLKTTLKKLKKYQIDSRTLQQSKNYLNLDLAIRWSKRVDQIIYNFIGELQELRQRRGTVGGVVGLIVEICDAYCVCGGLEFDVGVRRGVDLGDLGAEGTLRYFGGRMRVVGY